ncbi:hypothetical protein I6N95_05075 [Vagococcus sp. BWB3-3]|uniref:Uncharacterized protein n=1 Tax=Vagococcus allomyrinae TaxID=2794353 RepID=A0A940P9F6_9ENTE|nr:XtrA/YqaO family protein [Vagococcus allomyrinae]MBP1040382.1 hypothetical protein [Vagococcus allomyrinae]
MGNELEPVDLKNLETAQCSGSIIIVSEGKAYIKKLPQFGIVEIQTRDGKVVKGEDHTGWKLK